MKIKSFNIVNQCLTWALKTRMENIGLLKLVFLKILRYIKHELI